jgi:hypothetical protein
MVVVIQWRRQGGNGGKGGNGGNGGTEMMAASAVSVQIHLQSGRPQELANVIKDKNAAIACQAFF